MTSRAELRERIEHELRLSRIEPGDAPVWKLCDLLRECLDALDGAAPLPDQEQDEQERTARREEDAARECAIRAAERYYDNYNGPRGDEVAAELAHRQHEAQKLK